MWRDSIQNIKNIKNIIILVNNHSSKFENFLAIILLQIID